MISSYIKLFCHSTAGVVVIGRPMRRITGIESSHLRYKIYIHTYYAWNSCRLCQLISLMVSCLLLLPCSTAITGYQIINNNSNTQKQPTASYSQTNKLLLGVRWPIRTISTTNRVYVWQSKYATTMPTVLCTSNGPNRGYITGIHFCL